MQDKDDNKSGISCLTAHLHPVKTNSLKTKGYEKYFDTIIQTSIFLQSGLLLKDIPKLEKLKELKNVFE